MAKEIEEFDLDESLTKLADLDDKVFARTGEYNRAMEKLLSPIAGQLKRLKKQYEADLSPLKKKIERLEGDVRDAVVIQGCTVKEEHDRITAVYVKPKVTWNGERLEGLRAAYPAIDAARTEAEQGSAQIRRAKRE